MEWWQKTIVYECYVQSFFDTEGKGCGRLAGVTAKLDYLKKLGVGAVWLTPVFRSPMVDNGYDVASYTEIDPRYGTLADMDELIARAGEKGIRIVMDLVFNHTSDKHPWFKASASDKNNPYADWYIWRDPKEDGAPPNNWRGIFGGSAWTYCKKRGQYYLHSFAAEQPDLNWENPAVRGALYDVVRFWLDKGAGGFRLDAIPYIKKPAGLPDGIPDGDDGMVSIHTMTVNTVGILDYLKELKAVIKERSGVFTVGEANGIGPRELDQWVGDNGVFDMLFEFGHVTLPLKNGEIWCHETTWSISELKAALRASQKATARNGWYPIYFENHDHPRCVEYFFDEGGDQDKKAKAIGMLTCTLRGTPFLFQGQELGLSNVRHDDIEAYNDIASRGQYDIALGEGFTKEEAMAFVRRFSRDGARAPLPWDKSVNGGFTKGTPWLKLNDDYVLRNVEAEGENPLSVLNWYRKLSDLREEYPVLKEGNFREELTDDNDIIAYRRQNAKESMLVMVNLSAEQKPYPLSLTEAGRVVLNSHEENEPGLLAGYQALMFALPG